MRFAGVVIDFDIARSRADNAAAMDSLRSRGAGFCIVISLCEPPVGEFVSQYVTVQQGDHVSKIADRLGLSDYRSIWDHPKNAELKAKRKNPNVLLPGDQLFIPDVVAKEEARPTDDRHRFMLKGHRLKLRLRLQDFFGKAIANTSCELQVSGASYQLVTDADGVIEQRIPADAETGKLYISGLVYDLQIGHLDPVDEPSGLRARLNNLGYYTGDLAIPDEDLVQFAVALFQRDSGIPVDGEITAKLRDTLKKSFGC